MKETWPFSRERLRQLRRNAEGKCSRGACDKRVHKGGECKVHYAKTKKRLRKAYQEKKKEAAK